jgi:hypothetical protein
MVIETMERLGALLLGASLLGSTLGAVGLLAQLTAKRMRAARDFPRARLHVRR